MYSAEIQVLAMISCPGARPAKQQCRIYALCITLGADMCTRPQAWGCAVNNYKTHCCRTSKSTLKSMRCVL